VTLKPIPAWPEKDALALAVRSPEPPDEPLPVTSTRSAVTVMFASCDAFALAVAD
jgi:hypothetical protein